MREELSDKDLDVLVDRLVLEQGRLDPLELLLAAEVLTYEDYEAWRLGRRPNIQNALRLPPDEAAALLDRALAYGRALGLGAVPLRHLGWGPGEHPLTVGPDPGLTRACAEGREPADDRRQLDLFFDSRALVAESRLCEALAGRRPAQALVALRDLQAADPGHRRLRDYLHLIQILEVDQDEPIAPETRLAELKAIEPLASSLLRHRARDLLAPLWTALAEDLARRPFNPLAPHLHAAPAYARAGRWGAARAAVEAEPDWRGYPNLVLIHAEACRRGLDHTAVRRDWCGLCWDHPEVAANALDGAELSDLALAEHWVRFGDLDPPLDAVDFPAWLLCSDPGLRHAVSPDAAPAGPRGEAFRLLHRLVSGADTLAARQALSDLSPLLLRAYLAGVRPTPKSG